MLGESLGIGELIEELATIERWLSEFGVRTRGRIDAYRQQLLKVQSAGLDARDIRMLNAVHEVFELSKISKLPPSRFRERQQKRIRSLAKGQETYFSTGDDTARRFAFELLTAQMFLSLGLPSRLEDPADATVTLSRWSIHIECKRPDLPGTVTSNIEDGLSG